MQLKKSIFYLGASLILFSADLFSASLPAGIAESSPLKGLTGNVLKSAGVITDMGFTTSLLIADLFRDASDGVIIPNAVAYMTWGATGSYAVGGTLGGMGTGFLAPYVERKDGIFLLQSLGLPYGDVFPFLKSTANIFFPAAPANRFGLFQDQIYKRISKSISELLRQVIIADPSKGRRDLLLVYSSILDLLTSLTDPQYFPDEQIESLSLLKLDETRRPTRLDCDIFYTRAQVASLIRKLVRPAEHKRARPSLMVMALQVALRDVAKTQPRHPVVQSMQNSVNRMKLNIAQAYRKLGDIGAIEASGEYDDFSELRGAVVEDILEIEKALYLSTLSDQQIVDFTVEPQSYFSSILAGHGQDAAEGSGGF